MVRSEAGRKRPPDRTARRPGPDPKRSELLDGIEGAETRALCLGSCLDIPGEHRLQFLAIAHKLGAMLNRAKQERQSPRPTLNRRSWMIPHSPDA
jgi:hypothetical protein